MTINGFLEKYSESGFSRFHMPGHKGIYPFMPYVPVVKYDITEINGADSLYNATGIIKSAEDKAAGIYGTKASLFSAGGSTLCVGAMLKTACENSCGNKIIASRNAHSSFVNFCALFGLNPIWVHPEYNNETGLFEQVRAGEIEKALEAEKENNTLKDICGVYITSPDYMGQMADIKKIAEVCAEFKTPFLVDNAHGAHLKFGGDSRHPMDLGADMCCDSLHKTLPALTGASILHINKNTEFDYGRENVKSAMSILGSTSPSYLILASIENCLNYLHDRGSNELQMLAKTHNEICGGIEDMGISVLKNTDITKISMDSFSAGIKGGELAGFLRENKIEPEYVSDRYVVIIISPFNNDEDYNKLFNSLKLLKKKEKLYTKGKYDFSYPQVKLNPREALMAKTESINIREAAGKISAESFSVCPPGIPVIIMGEEIDENVIRLLSEYGREKIKTVKNKNR